RKAIGDASSPPLTALSISIDKACCYRVALSTSCDQARGRARRRERGRRDASRISDNRSVASRSRQELAPGLTALRDSSWDSCRVPGPVALVGSGEYLPMMAPVEAALLAGRPAR